MKIKISTKELKSKTDTKVRTRDPQIDNLFFN